MKKYLLISIILIAPNISFATSGACSSHMGVNCSAGPSVYGKVMCNDGWINSSINFSDAIECTTQNSCIPPQAFQYTSEAQCSGLWTLLIQNGSARYTPELANGQVQSCRDQVTNYQNALQKYNNCLTKPVPTYQTSIVPRHTPSSNNTSYNNSNIRKNSVFTAKATDISSNSAHLNAVVVLYDWETPIYYEMGGIPSPTSIVNKVVGYFEYGTTQSLGSTTQSKNLSPDDIDFRSLISVLPGKTYYFQAVIKTNSLINRGSIQSFSVPSVSNEITIKKSQKKNGVDTSLDHILKDSTSTGQAVSSIPESTHKITFWNKVSNLFKKLKFW